MRKILTIIGIFALLCAGCSNDDSSDSHFKLNVGGTDIDLNGENTNFSSGGSILRQSDTFYAYAAYGLGQTAISTFQMKFDINGNLIFISNSIQDERYGTAVYKNYKYFPSHYFNVDIISLDENSKRIKVAFSGKLYLRETDLDAEAIDISGEFDLNYEEDEGTHPVIQFSDFALNCSAKFNGESWEANHMTDPYTMPSIAFTAADAYKIDLYFAPNDNATAAFNVVPGSTDNYIRLSKFNTTTLAYDYYDVTGSLDYHYKEFHGAGSYTYFGSFNFAAVNPDNPSDIIQVTDGQFISYQKY